MADICVRVMIVGPWFGRVEFTLAWPVRQRMQAEAVVGLLYKCPYTICQATAIAAQVVKKHKMESVGLQGRVCGVFWLRCAEHQRTGGILQV